MLQAAWRSSSCTPWGHPSHLVSAGSFQRSLSISLCICAAGYVEPEAVSEELLEATINYSFLLAVNSTENVTMCTPEALQEAEFELSAFCIEVRPPTSVAEIPCAGYRRLSSWCIHIAGCHHGALMTLTSHRGTLAIFSRPLLQLQLQRLSVSLCSARCIASAMRRDYLT